MNGNGAGTDAGPYRSFATWVLLILLVAWTTLQILLPARFPGADDGYFKEPAYQWLKTGHFASPAFRGFYGLKPDLAETFAAYQPFYSWLYAGWIQIFPLSFRSAVAFDAIIHAGLVLTLMAVLKGLVPGATVAVTGLLVPLTCVFLGTLGRPDELALCLGYWGLALCLGSGPPRRPRAVWAGVLFGLCGCVSLPVLTVLAIWGGIVWFGDSRIRNEWSVTLVAASLAVVTGVCIMASVLIPFYSRDGAWAQYRTLSGMTFLNGLHRSLQEGNADPYLALLISALRSNRFLAPLVLCSYVLCGWVAWTDSDPRRRIRAFAGLSAVGFIVLTMPHQCVYHWFLLPLLLALVAESNWRHRWFRGALAMLIVVAVSAPLRDVAKSFWATGPQSVDAASRDVERIVPAGAKVLVSNRSYFLIRRHVKDLITDFDTAPDVKSVDYCVFGMFGGWEIKHTNGVYLSAELDSPENAAYLAAHFEEMTNNLPRVRPTLLGIPLSGFPVGYGTVIYKRRL